MSIFRNLSALFLTLLLAAAAFSQSYIQDMARQSARSDIRTGGIIEKTELVPDNPDLKLTVNIPSFEMTLWQGGREVKKYYVGVGLKDYPIFVGLRNINHVIWNPVWIPPSSDWVAPALRGQVIGPTDPRNPLGKIKMPLGYGYLIHQAKSSRDLGGLVSHGCVRVMRNDLYDLNDKFLIAQGLGFKEDTDAAKRHRRTYVVELDEPVRLEVTYDAVVVEAGMLHIYPDVYGYRNDKVGDLREELRANGIDESSIDDGTLEKMISKAAKTSQYVISLESIAAGKYLSGKVLSVVPRPGRKRSR